MKKLCRATFWFIIMSIIMQSCTKNNSTKPEPTYVLKGKLLAREDNLPNVGYNLVLITHTGYMGSEKREIGNTITDENGDFIFNVNTKYYWDLGFKGDIVRTFKTPFRPMAGDTIDIGTIKAYRR